MLESLNKHLFQSQNGKKEESVHFPNPEVARTVELITEAGKISVSHLNGSPMILNGKKCSKSRLDKLWPILNYFNNTVSLLTVIQSQSKHYDPNKRIPASFFVLLTQT